VCLPGLHLAPSGSPLPACSLSETARLEDYLGNRTRIQSLCFQLGLRRFLQPWQEYVSAYAERTRPAPFHVGACLCTGRDPPRMRLSPLVWQAGMSNRAFSHGLVTVIIALPKTMSGSSTCTF
jgi:hypothetical protein